MERFRASLPPLRSKLVHVYVDNGLIEAWRKEGLDETGARRAGQLAGLLNAMHHGRARTLELLARLDALERGEVEVVEDGGNDVALTARREGAEVVNNVFPDDPPARFTLQEVKDALLDWRDVLEEKIARREAGRDDEPWSRAYRPSR